MTEEIKREQIIEVDYNKDLVAEDLKIQETGTKKELVQDTFNEDGIAELLGEGAVIDDEIN